MRSYGSRSDPIRILIQAGYSEFPRLNVYVINFSKKYEGREIGFRVSKCINSIRSNSNLLEKLCNQLIRIFAPFEGNFKFACDVTK